MARPATSTFDLSATNATKETSVSQANLPPSLPYADALSLRQEMTKGVVGYGWQYGNSYYEPDLKAHVYELNADYAPGRLVENERLGLGGWVYAKTVDFPTDTAGNPVTGDQRDLSSSAQVFYKGDYDLYMSQATGNAVLYKNGEFFASLNEKGTQNDGSSYL
jgi:hypothetical protein